MWSNNPSWRHFKRHLNKNEMTKATDLYPFGKADVQAQLVYAAVLAATILNSETVLPIAQLTGAATLNLTVDGNVPVGSNLLVQVSADGTDRVLTFGTGSSAGAQTIPANTSKNLFFKYDGANFILMGTFVYAYSLATDVQAKAYASPVAATIAAKNTQITIAQMTGAATLNLTIGGSVPVGAKLLVFVSADATGRTLTLGTGLVGPATAITASKSVAIPFEYNGTNFVQTGLALQLN